MNKWLITAALPTIIFSIGGNISMMSDLSLGSNLHVRLLMLAAELLTIIFMGATAIIIISKQSKGALLALLCFSVLIMFLDRLALSTAYTVALYD